MIVFFSSLDILRISSWSFILAIASRAPEGFVHENYIGVNCQTSCNGNSLLLTARKLTGVTLLEAFETNKVDILACDICTLFLGYLLGFKTKLHIFENISPWEQSVILENGDIA